MAYELIRSETRGQVALIALNRPKALNALSLGMIREIATALATCLGPHVATRVAAPGDRASYGVVIPSGPRPSGPADLSRLHRGPDVLLASRDPERVLRALLAQLALHAARPDDLLLEAIAVGRAGRAVRVPSIRLNISLSKASSVSSPGR